MYAIIRAGYRHSGKSAGASTRATPSETERGRRHGNHAASSTLGPWRQEEPDLATRRPAADRDSFHPSSPPPRSRSASPKSPAPTHHRPEALPGDRK